MNPEHDHEKIQSEKTNPERNHGKIQSKKRTWNAITLHATSECGKSAQNGPANTRFTFKKCNKKAPLTARGSLTSNQYSVLWRIFL